ncbi:recombinase family protein [Bacteroides acidifaciens]|uniref:recombinase family protein n=1 Tax=Bacteroides acidifaciens TaxID=85831 RepID=UPI0025B79D69|nr:recombinase family protein [Bacteroides acidifaciens]
MKLKSSKYKKTAKSVVKFKELENKVAALWTRVSTERQEENNCSLDTQERICREYADAHGIRIKKHFGGTHESAKTEGELYRKMITEVAKDKEINIILVYSFDRFSRTGTEAIMTKAFLKTKGIYVVSATQATDPDSAAGEFMENIIFLFNQFENSLRRDKAVTGMTECLKRGDWYGKPPLGYDHRKEGKSHILTLNDNGRILKNAFVWKAEGVGDMEIIKRLKSFGLTIDKRHLNKLLHNPFYCGYITHNLLGVDENGEPVCVPGNQEKLIEESLFMKIQNQSRAGYEHKEEPDNFPLKRHVKCADCGGYLTGYTVKARGRDYYKCNKKGCKSNHSTEKLHDKYVAILNGYGIPDAFIPILSRVLKKVFETYNENKGTAKSLFKKRETEALKKIGEVKVKYGMGQIDESVYRATLSHLNTSLAEIRRGLEDSSQNLSNEQKFIDHVIVTSCKLGTLWEEANFTTRQKLQNLVFPNGIIYDKVLDDYRTDEENEVFKIFRRFTTSYMIDKEKATTELLRLSPCVGMRRLERPTPTSRT